jgi:hypothetical protein
MAERELYVLLSAIYKMNCSLVKETEHTESLAHRRLSKGI